MAETSDPGRGLPGSAARDPNGQDLVDDAVIDLTDRSTRPLASFVDERSGTTIEMHRPIDSPRRWQQYLDGAETQYRSWGVEQVLPRKELADGRRVSLVFVAVDDADRVVGGIRGHGPLRDASEAHALHEVAGTPVFEEARRFVELMIPFGVVEMKGAWTDPELAPRGVSTALARCCVHAMTWFGTRFSFGTGSTHTARLWGEAGSRPFLDLEGVPYPDDRYRTVMVHWDRGDVELHTSPRQWTALQRESQAFTARPGVEIVETEPSPIQRPEWRAEVLDTRTVVDTVRLLELQSDPGIEVVDRSAQQREELRTVRPMPAPEVLDDEPRWIYYPWRRCLVRVLGPEGFRLLRLDRNRNKITAEEQARLARLRVGVVGQSVGHAIAHAIALEGTCGELRLADFDELELSNLNRIPATVLDLGLNKSVVVARRIAEVDPYLDVALEPAGLDAGNLDEFVAGLDVVVEECDSLDVKALVREAARRAQVPVVMETSDRGLVDVERFDLDPDRPIFHGLLGDIDATTLDGLSTRDKVPHVLKILEADKLSSRMAASMAEIDETLTTWPQLGGDVLLGAATVVSTVRAIGTGRTVPSGRARIDLAEVLDGLQDPSAPAVTGVDPGPPPPEPPADPVHAVAHAANLAPSGGNAQPWRLELHPERLDIRLDRSRTSAMDVAHRGSYLATGAALLNARVASATHGLLGEVAIFPNGPDDDLVARLTFGRQSDPQLAVRYRAVLDRSSNRHPGDGGPIPAQVLAGLHREVEAEGAAMRVLTDSDEIARYADLLAESDRLRFLTPQLHREMMSEMRWPGLDELETGIDVRTLELDDADLAKLAVARRADVMARLAEWGGGRALGDTTRQRVPTSSAIVAVALPDPTPASYVAGGQAVERLWLAAHDAGLAIQPISPVSVFAVSARDLEALVPQPAIGHLARIDRSLRACLALADDDPIGLVLRLSHAPAPSVRSARLPLAVAPRPG